MACMVWCVSYQSIKIYERLSWSGLALGLLFLRTQDCVHVHGVLYFWVNRVVISALRKFSENNKLHILEGSILICVRV